MAFKLNNMNRSFQHGFIAGVITLAVTLIIAGIINQLI
jgi:hypothetical protein